MVREVRSPEGTCCKSYRNKSQALESSHLLVNREKTLLLARGLIVIACSKVHYLTKALDGS